MKSPSLPSGPVALGVILVVGVVTLAVISVTALGFHADGVGACGGCHSMHDGRFEPLLLANTATDVCLTCHSSETPVVYGVDPLNPTPEKGGGNFIFLLEDNINDGPDGLANPIPGHRAGHSVVAPGYGLLADPVHTIAPGGTYPAVDLGCTSCHDPHGSARFRMLWGAGDTVAGGFVFTNPAPQGDEIEARNGVESQTLHTAYRGGWVQWCANCHGVYHDESGGGFGHPMDETLGGSEADSYNRYSGEADPYGGLAESSYRPEVPFQDAAVTTTSTSGPLPGSRVVCMSCHRAHATSALAAVRWDPTTEFLDEDGVISGSRPIPNPYPGPTQRALCIKCHVDDTRDHGFGSACMECHRTIN